MGNTIKDSGETREFSTGSHRDMSVGKGRMDLNPAESVLRAKLALKDIMNNDILVDINSPKFHLNMAEDAVLAYLAGKRDKDYLAIASAYALCALGIVEADKVVEDYTVDDLNDLNSIFHIGLIAVSKHYEAGAIKYGENNWQLGQPMSVLLDSGLRHLCKAMAGIDDEPHFRATVWNFMSAIWMEIHRPEMMNLSTDSKNIN